MHVRSRRPALRSPIEDPSTDCTGVRSPSRHRSACASVTPALVGRRMRLPVMPYSHAYAHTMFGMSALNAQLIHDPDPDADRMLVEIRFGTEGLIAQLDPGDFDVAPSRASHGDEGEYHRSEERRVCDETAAAWLKTLLSELP